MTALALMSALAMSCADSGARHEQVNLGGYSPEFKQGYADGCGSAGGGRQRRNEDRYRTEADYMMGWNDGFSICHRRR